MSKKTCQIAIVDDDPLVLKAFKRLLSTRSLDARTYDSSLHFLASLDNERPDCLILDVHMPHMTGLELRMNMMRRGIRIPTIFISAHSDPGTRARCEAAGAVAFLAKPISDDALFSAIEAAVGFA